MLGLRSALCLTVVTAVVSTASVVPLTARPAAAISPGVGFTADPAGTYQTNGIVWSLAEANGVVYVGGRFNAVRPPGSPAGSNETPASNFIALSAATGQPTSCRLNFTGNSSAVRAVAVSPDRSTLYAGGLFSGVSGVPSYNLAAIDLATCTARSTFRPQIGGWVRAMSVAPDGNVYLAGEFQNVNGQSRPRFAAVSPAGALLAWSPVADLPGYAVAVVPDGSAVVVGGAFNRLNGDDSHALAVVDSTAGANVRTFPRFFIHRNTTTKHIYADSTGIYSSHEGTGGGVFDGRLALELGTYDQRWRDTCLGATQATLPDDGRLYSAHHAHDCSSMGGFPDGRRQHLSSQGTHDPTWDIWWPDTNDGIGELIGPRALTLSEASGRRYLFVGGEFTTVNGSAQQSLTRLPDAPDIGAPTTPTGLSGSSPVAGRVQVRWLASTDRDDGELTYNVYRNGSSTPIGTVTATSDWWRRPQVSFVDTSVTAGQTYTYRIRAADPVGNTSNLSGTVSVQASTTTSVYAQAVLGDEPTLYWRYGETSGTSLVDDAPTGATGQLQGGYTLGVSPGALTNEPGTNVRFDGSGWAYQTVARQRPQAFSTETWFRTTTSSGGRLLGFGNATTGTSNSYDKHVYMRNDGRLVFGVWTSSAQTVVSPGAYNDGQWHHVVATQGPAGMALYVDGVSVGTNGTTTNQAYQGYWRVGSDNLNGWPNRPSSNGLAGDLDESAVYDRALSAQEVEQHHRSGAPGPDTQPPTAPAGVGTSVSGSDVTLTWTASSDDVGVTGYQVHRSGTQGFTPSAGTRIADVPVSPYQDQGLAQGSWYYRVVAVDGAGNLSSPSAEASATVLPPDEQAPTAPAGLTAVVSGADVQLGWTASQDDVGVTGYEVHRSGTSGFVPGAATRVTTVPATSFTDQARPPGTWHYRVLALDAAGNTSAPSAQASATVVSTDPVTRVLQPTEDTFVNSAAPGTPQGSSASLASRATPSVVTGYLRFDVPAAPPGQVLTSASLRITTNSSSTAGSSDSHVVAVGPAGWDEATLTWNTRPPAPSPRVALGTVTGATQTSTAYTVPLDVAVLGPAASDTLDMTISSDAGDDILWFWSSEAAPSLRPQLVLGYEIP